MGRKQAEKTNYSAVNMGYMLWKKKSDSEDKTRTRVKNSQD